MVFQSVTLEGWTYIMIKLQRVFNSFAVLYFVLLVLVGAFFLLNLTLAVITIFFTNAQRESQQHLEEKKEKSID